jgi:hypothetical protein
MRILLRFALGFVVGCTLTLWSTLLAGAGEGAVSPLVSSAPMLVWIAALTNFGLLGFWLLVFATGLLWAIYFGGLPAINSFIVRTLAVGLVGCVHLGSAVWMLSKDLNFAREYERLPIFTAGYFVFLWVVIMTLGLLTWAGPKRRAPRATSL